MVNDEFRQNHSQTEQPRSPAEAAALIRPELWIWQNVFKNISKRKPENNRYFIQWEGSPSDNEKVEIFSNVSAWSPLLLGASALSPVAAYGS